MFMRTGTVDALVLGQKALLFAAVECVMDETLRLASTVAVHNGCTHIDATLIMTTLKACALGEFGAQVSKVVALALDEEEEGELPEELVAELGPVYDRLLHVYGKHCERLRSHPADAEVRALTSMLVDDLVEVDDDEEEEEEEEEDEAPLEPLTQRVRCGCELCVRVMGFASMHEFHQVPGACPLMNAALSALKTVHDRYWDASRV